MHIGRKSRPAAGRTWPSSSVSSSKVHGSRNPALRELRVGCDFPGLGPHSFRRANITWRQEVGGSSIEASKIAGHSTVRMTEEYTKIQLTRQEELTRLIQERLASVGEKQTAVVQ
jgi:integrase